MRRLPLALALPFLLAACGGGNKEQAAPPDSTAIALEKYSPTLFDTITWPSDSAKTNRGEVVFNFSCKKCHGQLGHGDGEAVAQAAAEGDTIKPPNFATDWRFGSDREAALKAVYAGTQKGMPHWGLTELNTRDVDAVVTYVMKNLAGVSALTVQTPKS